MSCVDKGGAMRKIINLVILTTTILILSLVWVTHYQKHQLSYMGEVRRLKIKTNKAKGSESLVQVSPTKRVGKVSEIISEKYEVSNDEKNLVGVITAPKNYRREKRPLLVISHGFNNTLEMYEEYAIHLAQLGYIVYRFDFFGGSTHSKSGGNDMLSMSILTEKNDLTTVISQLSNESFVLENDLTLLGASQGGVVSTLYAADHKESVKNLILVFPAFVLFDDVRKTYASLGLSYSEEIPDIITHKNTKLGGIYIKDAMTIDCNKEIQKVNSKVLIIQGTNDDVVPYHYSREAANLFSNSKLVTVEGGGHWINSDFNKIALPAIDHFLN